VSTEYGLYNLILASRKKGSKSLQTLDYSWKLLPDIRRHGAYMTPAKLEEVLLNPDTIIQLATELKRAQEERDALSIRNSELTVQKHRHAA